MSVLFVNQLTVIDCSVLDAVRGIVGESWIVDIELEGDLNDEGMVFDFGCVKKEIKRFFDDILDHRLLIPSQLEALNTVPLADGRIRVEWQNIYGGGYIESPNSALQFIEAADISITALNVFSLAKLKALLPSNVNDVRITLRNEEIDGAYYQYSHGLKKHNGACQHIAHGHRSRIGIFDGDVRLTHIETYWAKRFEDIYIGTKEDIIEESDTHTVFEYTAPKGLFKLAVPTQSVALMETETTVEQIADYLYKETKAEFPDYSELRVMAFEGVEKGAISYG